MAGTKTTTEADAALLVKKRLWYSIPIDIGSSRTAFVQVRGDAAEYFNITIPTAATTTSGLKEVIRKTTGKITRYGAGLLDTTPTEVNTDVTQKYFIPPRISSGGGGRAIVIPTELKTARGNIRTHTMRFPSSAINAAISVWLFNECKAKKPTWFRTQFGTRYAVVTKGSVNDINSGNQKNPITPPE